MRRSKAVLVVGGSGFIGTHLCMKLREGYKLFATYTRHRVSMPGVSYLPFNVLDREWIKRVIYGIQPEVIIFAAGSNNVEHAEKEPREVERIHTGGSASVSAVADILKPKFIFLSNNYVFEGKRGNYRETDIILPGTALGKAKVGGENFIKGKSLNYTIVRSSPVYGRGNGINLTFLDRLRVRLSEGTRMELPTTELHSFAPVYGLVDFVARLVDGGPRNKVLHYGGLTKLTYYDFAREFAKRFKFDPGLITPKRPAGSKEESREATYDFSLNSSEIAATLKVQPLLLEEGFDLVEKNLVGGA